MTSMVKVLLFLWLMIFVLIGFANAQDGKWITCLDEDVSMIEPFRGTNRVIVGGRHGAIALLDLSTNQVHAQPRASGQIIRFHVDEQRRRLYYVVAKDNQLDFVVASLNQEATKIANPRTLRLEHEGDQAFGVFDSLAQRCCLTTRLRFGPLQSTIIDLEKMAVISTREVEIETRSVVGNPRFALRKAAFFGDRQLAYVHGGTHRSFTIAIHPVDHPTQITKHRIKGLVSMLLPSAGGDSIDLVVFNGETREKAVYSHYRSKPSSRGGIGFELLNQTSTAFFLPACDVCTPGDVMLKFVEKNSVDSTRHQFVLRNAVQSSQLIARTFSGLGPHSCVFDLHPRTKDLVTFFAKTKEVCVTPLCHDSDSRNAQTFKIDLQIRGNCLCEVFCCGDDGQYVVIADLVVPAVNSPPWQNRHQVLVLDRSYSGGDY
ncbi:MAG: hypothetical protein WBD20_19820 [Pirellulaceae bacterium]